METIVTPLLSALLGGTIVAVVTHLLTSRRERQRNKREFNLKYLIDAWKNLNKGSRDDVGIHEKAPALESAIADVQLFGSPAQIRMAQKIAQEMTEANTSNTTDLLHDLRDGIRRELELEKAPEGAFFFRITPLTPRPGQMGPHK